MSKLVMVIEDDEDILRNLGDLLENEGYVVETANDGKVALEKLAVSVERPSLILLDLMMPVMDGFQFRKEQEKDSRFAPIPVVIMTADGNIEEKRRRIGAKDFLRKPVDIETLLKVVKENTAG